MYSNSHTHPHTYIHTHAYIYTKVWSYSHAASKPMREAASRTHFYTHTHTYKHTGVLLLTRGEPNQCGKPRLEIIKGNRLSISWSNPTAARDGVTHYELCIEKNGKETLVRSSDTTHHCRLLREEDVEVKVRSVNMIGHSRWSVTECLYQKVMVMSEFKLSCVRACDVWVCAYDMYVYIYYTYVHIFICIHKHVCVCV